jgi:2-methylcitrate dehydratase PrpD
MHSCCGHTHTAIDIALKLLAGRGWSAEEVVRNVADIQIETYGPGYQIVKEMNPRTPYQAKFSLAYTVAAAMLEGQAGLQQFSEVRFGPNGLVDQQIIALLQRTRVVVDDMLTRKYPAAWPSQVTITLRNGAVLRGASDYPCGNPENAVSTAELERKFLSLVIPRLGESTARTALDAVHQLDCCQDVAKLFRNLVS